MCVTSGCTTMVIQKVCRKIVFTPALVVLLEAEICGLFSKFVFEFWRLVKVFVFVIIALSNFLYAKMVKKRFVVTKFGGLNLIC